MDKQAKAKLLWIIPLVILMLAIGVYAYSISLDNDFSTQPGTWVTTNRDLYINVTPTINTDYSNFAICGADNAQVGANITQYAINLSAEWVDQIYSNFTRNFTGHVVNGTTFQINITNLPESDSQGWKYYITLSNTTTMNYCGLNFTHQSNTFIIKVDNSTPRITVDRPLPFANLTSDEVFFNATMFDRNPSTGTCQLFHNASGTHVSNVTSFYTNNSVVSYTANNVPDGNYYSYFWRCSDEAGNVNTTNNVTFHVDATSPTITLNTPANGSWVTSKTINFNFTVVDSNINYCTLYANFTNDGNLWSSDASGNNGTLGLNGGTVKITSNIATENAINATVPEIAYSGGGYLYALRCNDTFGRMVQSQNYTVFVDATAPNAFAMNLANRTSSDHTPNFTINFTSDINFDKYNLQIADDNAFTSVVRSENYSGNAALHGLVLSSSNKLNASSTARGLNTYVWRVAAYDLAGNRRLASNGSFSYTTDEVCANLSTGYNYCGIIGDFGVNKTLSEVASESKAQNVYVWNNNLTSAGFISHTAGLSTNQYVNVTLGDVVVVYINSTGPYLWEDRVWGSSRIIDYNFTAHNTSGYHLVSIQNSTKAINFTDIWSSLMGQNITIINDSGIHVTLNDTIRYWSYSNNTKLGDPLNRNQFVPYNLLNVYKTYNAGVPMKYGEALWAYNINYTSTYVNNTKFAHVYWNRSLGGVTV